MDMAAINKALQEMNEDELTDLLCKILDRLDEIDPPPEGEETLAWEEFCKRYEEEWSKEDSTDK